MRGKITVGNHTFESIKGPSYSGMIMYPAEEIKTEKVATFTRWEDPTIQQYKQGIKELINELSTNKVVSEENEIESVVEIDYIIYRLKDILGDV